MSKTIKQAMWGIGFLSLGLVVLVLLTFMRPRPVKNHDKPKPPLVEVTSVAPETVQFRIASQGTVTPYARTTVVAEVSGRILAVSDQLRTGGFFPKGAWLLSIDPKDYEIALAEAQAQLAAQQAKLAEEEARAEQAANEWRLTGKPLSAAPPLALRKPQIAQAKANVAIAKAGVERAKRQLERTQLRAPYDAWVESVQAYQGQFVNVGSTLATLFSARKAEVVLPVTEQDMPFIRLPQDGQAAASLVHFRSASGQAGEEWVGQLVRVDARMDERNRVYRVVAELEDPYGLSSRDGKAPLRVGSFVLATIDGVEREGIFRIRRDLLRGDNKILVRDREGRLRARSPKLIHQDKRWVYATSGFDVGDMVITSSLESWVEGMPLRVADNPGQDKDNRLSADNGEEEAQTKTLRGNIDE